MSFENDLCFVYRVEPEHGGERLDRFLAAAASAENLSRTRVKSLIEAGHASIDGAMVIDPSQLLRAGQTACLSLPPPVDPVPLGENIPLHIVFEDEHLLVIDKPAGLVVHPAAGHESGTLVNALIAHCGSSLSGIGGVTRPGIVPRLDKDTTGLMVAAKNDRAHKSLTEQFADHGRTGAMRRGYMALVWGVPNRQRGTVDAPIDRHPHAREKMAVRPGGREAVTHWEIREVFVGR